jgi:pyrroline-5-carboxylate reductase
MKTEKKIAILGCGNIGSSIAEGLLNAGSIDPSNLILTRRHTDKLAGLKGKGAFVTDDNSEAVREADIVILAVTPQKRVEVLSEIKSVLIEKKHTLISLVTGASISEIKENIGKDIPIIRAMPNTAISIGESMTCLSSEDKYKEETATAEKIFKTVGETFVLKEELMIPATALVACGVAFFLRAVRAASQGGVEVGFHAEDAIKMAAQTAKGAASLILEDGLHPESEVDKVTTPRGCTISGLNQMEHNGFSSAMIKGITIAAEKCYKI